MTGYRNIVILVACAGLLICLQPVSAYAQDDIQSMKQTAWHDIEECTQADTAGDYQTAITWCPRAEVDWNNIAWKVSGEAYYDAMMRVGVAAQDFADALASTGDRYAAWAAVNQAIKELTMVVERSKSANTVYYSKQALSTAQALREHIKGMP